MKVYFEEEGVPLPRPYSRDEPYSLQLLTAYFVSRARRGVLVRHLVGPGGVAGTPEPAQAKAAACATGLCRFDQRRSLWG